MKINKNEMIVGVDVDETLVMHHPEDYENIKLVKLNYYGHPKEFGIHQDHIELIKAYKKRGFYVRVHSANGVQWAKEVVIKLGLEDFVDDVETKMAKFVDDKDALYVFGTNVYVPLKKKNGEY